jgi:hypothetical protein
MLSVEICGGIQGISVPNMPQRRVKGSDDMMEVGLRHGQSSM